MLEMGERCGKTAVAPKGEASIYFHISEIFSSNDGGVETLF